MLGALSLLLLFLSLRCLLGTHGMWLMLQAAMQGMQSRGTGHGFLWAHLKRPGAGHTVSKLHFPSFWFSTLPCQGQFKSQHQRVGMAEKPRLSRSLQ